MKLYYSPGACSLSPHIILNELGLKYEVEKVDTTTKKTETGQDYNSIAEKSAVPLLQLDNGEKLTEGSAIVQYLADLKPELGLAPKNGTFERTRLHELLNYLATEVHKPHAPLFNPDYGPVAAEAFRKKIKSAYDYLSGKLKGKKFLLGDHFTVTDAYLFTILNWSHYINLDLSAWPLLVEYQKRIAMRPSVHAAMKDEGLLDTKAA